MGRRFVCTTQLRRVVRLDSILRFSKNVHINFFSLKNTATRIVAGMCSVLSLLGAQSSRSSAPHTSTNFVCVPSSWFRCCRSVRLVTFEVLTFHFDSRLQSLLRRFQPEKKKIPPASAFKSVRGGIDSLLSLPHFSLFFLRICWTNRTRRSQHQQIFLYTSTAGTALFWFPRPLQVNMCFILRNNSSLYGETDGAPLGIWSLSVFAVVVLGRIGRKEKKKVLVSAKKGATARPLDTAQQ